MAREDSLTAGLNQIRISPSHSNANSLSTLQPVGSASSISEIHEKRFPSWLSSVANGVMKNFDMVDHRKVQPVLHEESSDSEDEEEETSQEKLSSLLWEAQVSTSTLCIAYSCELASNSVNYLLSRWSS